MLDKREAPGKNTRKKYPDRALASVIFSPG
jgi:hypothetical protein